VDLGRENHREQSYQPRRLGEPLFGSHVNLAWLFSFYAKEYVESTKRNRIQAINGSIPSLLLPTSRV
jgi:hypothetical protein